MFCGLFNNYTLHIFNFKFLFLFILKQNICRNCEYFIRIEISNGYTKTLKPVQNDWLGKREGLTLKGFNRKTATYCF